MAGFRQDPLIGAYSGGTVRDLHTVHYSSPGGSSPPETLWFSCNSSILAFFLAHAYTQMLMGGHYVRLYPPALAILIAALL